MAEMVFYSMLNKQKNKYKSPSVRTNKYYSVPRAEGGIADMEAATALRI